MTKSPPMTDLTLLHRLGKTSEALGQLQSVIARCIVQGVEEIDLDTGISNREDIEIEIADVYAQLDCTIDALLLDVGEISRRRNQQCAQMIERESLFENAPAPVPPAEQGDANV